MEHGGIGHAYGRAGYGSDIRLACHGLDKNDNDFVVGLLGPDLYPLSSIVQRMRKTRQTSLHLERLGPFLIGRAVWQKKEARMSTAVLLLAYGGPDSLDDIPAYLLDIRGGRETPQALIDEITHRYAEIGGRSPLLPITRNVASTVADAAGICRSTSACVTGSRGSRTWWPRWWQDGVTRVVVICMAPHYSSLSIGAYRKRLDEALAATGATMDVHFVESWHTQPEYLDALAANVRGHARAFPSRRGRAGCFHGAQPAGVHSSARRAL